MKTFKYKITDEIGLHIRPAGVFVSIAKFLDSKIIMEKSDKTVDATKLFAVMTMGAKKATQ